MSNYIATKTSIFNKNCMQECVINTDDLVGKNLAKNEDEVSLEEQYEKELEAQEAAQNQSVAMQEIQENVPVNENTIQIQEIPDDVENETQEEAREAYMQEMEDNYSNFMDQLQMDSES